MSITIADLAKAMGCTEQEIAEKMLGQAVEQILGVDCDGDFDGKSFHTQMQNRIQDTLDAQVAKIGEEKILPQIIGMTENLILQETNRWGEKKGQPVTFTEYMVQQVDHWIREEVNHAGKTKAEDSYGWRKNTTRIAYMIHEHLQYNISTAVKKALGDLNASVAGGLQKAVMIQIEQTLGQLKIQTKA